MQILLLMIGVPSLLFMIIRIRRDKKEKTTLFVELEKNNREYLFDPGTPINVSNERDVIHHSITNFKKAAGFINQMAQGNYQVNWEELNESNQQLNQTNLAGELSQMRERLKEVKDQDDKRRWATEGIAQFSEIIRSNENLTGLSEKIVGFVVKYLGAQQGSLFMVRDENEKYLELTACYAFDRKKFLSKRVEVGQGLVGQTYLEKQTNVLTEIPQGYIAITSGLGDSTPSCLLVTPMLHNENVEAVIEIASFTRFEAHQVEWLEKVGEITASTLLSAKTTEHTQHLLEQFREQTEQLRAQEEELRQNMEELEATQEEMRRKEVELNRRQQESQLSFDLNKD
jgi:prefoldin subunit 5